jgi:hypothetical protein
MTGVAAVDRGGAPGGRARSPHPVDGIENDRAHGLGPHVAGQHGIQLGERPALLDAQDDLGDVRGRDQRAARCPITGVVGERHGQHRIDVVAQPLQREDSRGVARMTEGHVRLDGQDLHLVCRSASVFFTPRQVR